jgi:hypothetical protein
MADASNSIPYPSTVSVRLFMKYWYSRSEHEIVWRYAMASFLEGNGSGQSFTGLKPGISSASAGFSGPNADLSRMATALT